MTAKSPPPPTKRSGPSSANQEKWAFLRLIIDKKVATRVIKIDALKIDKLSLLVQHVQDNLLPALLNDDALSRLNLSAEPLIVCQENTPPTKGKLKNRWYTVLRKSEAREYGRWYERNVTKQPHAAPKLELHLASKENRMQLEEELKEVGAGGNLAKSVKKEYRLLAARRHVTSVHKLMGEYKWEALNFNELSAETVVVCFEADGAGMTMDESTDDYLGPGDRSFVVRGHRATKRKRMNKAARQAKQAAAARAEEAVETEDGGETQMVMTRQAGCRWRSARRQLERELV
jgi:hypothetical protein